MISPSSRLRIIVGGTAGRFPIGGVAWDYFQYVLGLADLGHDVYYYDDTGTWPFDPRENAYSEGGEYTARFLGEFFEAYAPDLSDRWHYVHLRSTGYGMDREAFAEVAGSADVFLNVSGACYLPDSLSPTTTKVFLDTDPGYNQILLNERFAWAKDVDDWVATVKEHDRFFTYAENISGSDCIVPTLGFDWETTRMPIVMRLWDGIAEAPPEPQLPWTTVMTWNGFPGPLIYRGVEYRSKDGEFEKLIDLPSRSDADFLLAIGGETAPRDALIAAGWELVEGPDISLTPASYQAFIAGSRGEISPAKNVYVATRTGWFSCRSACYLAGGRPVVAQDTGFGVALPVGEGLLSFRTGAEAAAAIAEIEADHERHARAARALAQEHFDSRRVLGDLIDRLAS